MGNPQKVLVTGASGFIGSKIVPRLLAAGYTVRTFGRSAGNPEYSDATDNAVAGCDIVFHLAGLVSYRSADTVRQHDINVNGTRYVMEAALKHGISRVIYTGSIAGMGIPEAGTTGDESFEYNLKGRGLNYCDSKYEGELEVHRLISQGLPAVILNPGIILGEGDTHPHHKAIFLIMSRGWLIGWPPGGVTFCDIEDIVQAHVNALSRGRIGERYVLGSANLTFREAALALSRVFNSSPPRFEIPAWALDSLGAVMETVAPWLGMKPQLTRQVAWLCRQEIFFSFQKSIDELGVTPTPFEETVRRITPYYLGKNHPSEG